MAKYLVQGSYTADGARGLKQSGGSSRKQVIEGITASMGGTLEAFYYALGEDDVVCVIDLPGGNVDAAAVGIAVGSSGAVNIRTTALLTPQEIDSAVAKDLSYRPPGQ